MDLTQMLNRPKIALIGEFDDNLKEGLESLEMKFDVCKLEKGCKRDDYDLAVIAPDFLNKAEEIVKKLGVVPVVLKNETKFVGFDVLKETGNAFTYEKHDTWHILEALIKAQETYRFKYDWKTVQKGVQLVVS